MKIRVVEETDLQEVFKLAQGAFKKPWSLKRFQKQFKEERKLFLVAEEGGIIGFSIARSDGLYMLIAVSPGQRGKRVGSELLKETLSALKREGVKRAFGHVRKSNEKVLDFYTKHGFRKKPEPGYYSDEDGWRLEKTL